VSGRPFFCAFFTLWSRYYELVRSTDLYIYTSCYDASVFLFSLLQFEHVLKQKGKNGPYSVDTVVTGCTERECFFTSTTLMPYRFAVLCVIHTHICCVTYVLQCLDRERKFVFLIFYRRYCRHISYTKSKGKGSLCFIKHVAVKYGGRCGASLFMKDPVLWDVTLYLKRHNSFVVLTSSPS
jgi:hypothetical protein